MRKWEEEIKLNDERRKKGGKGRERKTRGTEKLRDSKKELWQRSNPCGSTEVKEGK